MKNYKFCITCLSVLLKNLLPKYQQGPMFDWKSFCCLHSCLSVRQKRYKKSSDNFEIWGKCLYFMLSVYMIYLYVLSDHILFPLKDCGRLFFKKSSKCHNHLKKRKNSYVIFWKFFSYRMTWYFCRCWGNFSLFAPGSKRGLINN